MNGNYEEFLSLGGDLKGGEEKVEGVRVGLLGFQREVEGVQRAVREREREVGRLLVEKKGLRKGVVLGRTLLEVEESVTELEERLGVTEKDDEAEEESDLDDEDDVDQASPSKAALTRLQRHAQQYVLIMRQVDRIGKHPFLNAQQSRLNELRKTLLLDLAAAMRQAKSDKAPDRILAVVRIYGDLNAEREAVKVLKSG